jgi:choline monooxygenase
VLRCPYHGWSYGLDGSLKGTPEFEGVADFERAQNGLAPLAVAEQEDFVFVRVAEAGTRLPEFLGSLASRMAPLGLERLRFFERRSYELACNWKVFVDNYLDGGYHVPHLHKGLSSVLRHAEYTVESGERFCLQSSPLKAEGAEAETSAARGGDRAHYFWLYPNFMVNYYAGVMDTNLVLPLAVDRTRVVFDFFFADVSAAAVAANRRSVLIAERIQNEDVAICESVQRGLASRAYRAGRLSVRREAGEHLFHRLLAADLRRGVR